MIMWICSIFIAALVSIASGQFCPSNQYTQCANEHKTCHVPDTIDEGYISYGYDGKFTLVPFTNDHSDGTDLEVLCNNDLGDVYLDTFKYCCYIEAPTGFNGTFKGNMAQNGGGFQFSNVAGGLWAIRYGHGDRYLYRVIGGEAIGYCNDNDMGDMLASGSKHCQYWEGAPAAIANIEESEWTICGNEWDACTQLDGTMPQWVRFGDNDDYFYRLVIATDVPCREWLFEDPVPSTSKYCWRGPVDYKFAELSGEWVALNPCSSCGTTEYQFTVGVKAGESSTTSQTWSTSVQYAYSAGFEMKAISASTEISIGISHSITQENSKYFEQEQSSSFTFVCERDQFYQWVQAGSFSNGLTTETFTVKFPQFACVDLPLEPVCPPGFAREDTHQSPCLYEVSFEGWIPANEGILPECTGDCDGHDHSCAYDLICYHDQIPPGCIGTSSSRDYCGEDTASSSAPFPIEAIPVRVPPRSVPTSITVWSVFDWYHAHYYGVAMFLAVTLVVLCGLNLCAMARSGGASKRAYGAVKYMESDTEQDVEADPIQM